MTKPGGQPRLASVMRDKRVQLGITQVDLAARCGVSQGVVSDWERGVSTPSIRRLLLLARHLQIDTGELDRLIDENGEAA